MGIKSAVAGLSIVGLAVSGCSSGDQPVESKDLAAYACALADELNDPAESWGEGEDGSEALMNLWSSHLVVNLTGSAMSVDLGGFSGLSEAARELNRGLTHLDFEMIDDGIDQVRAVCLGEDLLSNSSDVSVSGRIAFGCRIAQDIDPDEIDIEAAVRTDDGSAMTVVKLISTANLLGDIAARDEVPSDLYDSALEVFRSVGNVESEAAAAAVGEVQEKCAEI